MGFLALGSFLSGNNMKAVWQYFKDFHKEVIHPPMMYLLISLFIAILTAMNYLLLDIRFEKWMYQLKPIEWTYLAHFVLFGFIYFGIIFICYRYKTIPNLFKNKAFMVKSLIMLLILTLDVCFHYHTFLIRNLFEFQDRFFMYKVSNQITSLFIILLPLFFYYRKYEKDNTNFYGLNTSVKKIGQYMPLILIMMPLIGIASFEENIRDFYPQFSSKLEFMNWSVELRAIVFEFFYAFDFLTTEFLFRGFMVLGFVAFLGPRAVLPMVGLYVALHFGKPAGETIGSFFGGYILGVLTYQSKNIWGGIVVHIGIALLMELAAWMQNTFN